MLREVEGMAKSFSHMIPQYMRGLNGLITLRYGETVDTEQRQQKQDEEMKRGTVLIIQQAAKQASLESDPHQRRGRPALRHRETECQPA